MTASKPNQLKAWHFVGGTLRRQRDVLLDMLIHSGVRYADIARARLTVTQAPR